MSKRKSTAERCEREVLREPFDHAPALTIKADKSARIPHSNAGKAIPIRVPTRFRDDGFDLHLIKQNGQIAIYGKSKPTYHAGYETVIIHTLPARNAFGKYYPAREVYPYSEQWGKYGWTYRTLAEANRKFTSLIEEREAR